MPKDGTSKGRRWSHYDVCGRCTIPDAACQRPGPADKERSLAIYQEGSSLSAIARIFGVTVQAVSKWVKKRGPPPGSDASAGRKAHCGRSGSPAGGGDCV